jgi:hypothetical protein
MAHCEFATLVAEAKKKQQYWVYLNDNFMSCPGSLSHQW